MRKSTKIVLKVAVILIALYAVYGVLLAVGLSREDQKNKTQEALNRISITKITLDDVMGKNLPPKPEQTLNDSTIAGIDANGNVIRDDVELAIFEKYSNSAKVRAAMLQYAQALQLELTEVFNSETLVEVLQKRSYGQSCIDKTDTNFSITEARVSEVEEGVFNTENRKTKHSEVLNNYMTTYSVPANSSPCNINPSSLPN